MRYMLKDVLRFTIDVDCSTSFLSLRKEEKQIIYTACMAGETKLLKRIQMTWTPDNSSWVFFSVQKQGVALRLKLIMSA